MSQALQFRFTRVVPPIAVMFISAVVVHAQENPYNVAEGWPQLPEFGS